MCRSQFISQALLYGDNQRYCVALIVPDFVEIKAWLLKNNKGIINIYVFIYIYICIYIYMHIKAHVYMYVCM
jgi:hypothetical protein